MVYRRASLFFAGLSPTPRHSIAEPEPSILSQEIAPRFSVREGPSPRFGSSPPPLLGQNGMKKLGVGKEIGRTHMPHLKILYLLPGNRGKALFPFTSVEEKIRLEIFGSSAWTIALELIRK